MTAHPAAPTSAPTVSVPDATGHFGRYGGRFVPEALVVAIDQLTAAFHETQADPAFRAELLRLHRDYTGRPSPLTDAPKFGDDSATWHMQIGAEGTTIDFLVTYLRKGPIGASLAYSDFGDIDRAAYETLVQAAVAKL